MTYAIFKAAGFQYRAELGEVLRLPSMDAEVGDTVTFDEVLLGATDDEVLVGRPTVEGAAIRARVLAHDRADKIVVFKFKRRKNYRRKTGHRQDYTEIRVQEIDLGGDRKVTLEPEAKPAKKKAAAKEKTGKKKATAKKAAAAKKTAKVEAKSEEKAEPKAKKKRSTSKKKKASKKKSD